MAHFEALWILWTTPAAGLQRQEPGVEDLATLVWFYSQGVHRICEATFQVYCVSGPVFFCRGDEELRGFQLDRTLGHDFRVWGR